MAFKQQVTPITQQANVAGNITSQIVTSKGAGAVKVPSKVYHKFSDDGNPKSPSPNKHGDGSGLSPQQVEMNTARTAFGDQFPAEGDYTQEQYNIHDAELDAIRTKYASSEEPSPEKKVASPNKFWPMLIAAAGQKMSDNKEKEGQWRK